MNAVVKMPSAGIPALAMNETELIDVLRNSLYPGAADNSIKLVISYCKASGLDPMQKPVHIVPIWDSKASTMRDVVMPGIGLYRTQAARSGEYAGVSEPEFGPDVEETLGGVQITYPAWCRVTIKRQLANGILAEFSATERWKENYATQKRDSVAPNAMWKRRPYAQLAKCAEAQALRKAFPEFGAQPTADEMEGKEIDMGTVERVESGRQELPPYPAESFERNFSKWADSGTKTPDDFIAMLSTKGVLSDGQKARIRNHKRDGVMTPAEIEEARARELAETQGEQQ